MHNYLLSIILNHSIIVTTVIALLRIRTITRNFCPFIFLIWLGLANESLSLVMIYNSNNNAINSNIFVLLEFGLIILQFFIWNRNHRSGYVAIAALGVMVWITDNFILNNIAQNNSLFRTFYSLVIVFYSINQINKMLIFERENLLKNAIVIICIAFLFYFGCKAFVEAFNAFHLGLTAEILQNLWIILYFVNAVANILYAIAILCIPTKQAFTLPY